MTMLRIGIPSSMLPLPRDFTQPTEPDSGETRENSQSNNQKTARMTQHEKDSANLVRPSSGAASSASSIKKQKLLQSTSKIVIGAMERLFYR